MKNFSDEDKGFDQLMSTFKLGGESFVNVGYLRSSGIHKKSEEMTVAQIAAIHEFGSADGKIPQRSFMRSSMDDRKEKLALLIEKLTGKVVDKEMTPDRALGVVGEFVKEGMVQKINSNVPPPNAPETINRKGSSKTLIDTGQMKNSIDWEIVKGK